LHFLDLVSGEKVTRAQTTSPVPCIRTADLANDDEDERRVSAIDHDRKQLGVQIVVGIVEGEQYAVRREVSLHPFSRSGGPVPSFAETLHKPTEPRGADVVSRFCGRSRFAN